MKKEDKYNVSMNITMNVEKLDENGKIDRDFHKAGLTVEYPGLDYLQFVSVQQALIHLLQILNNMGWADSEVSGFDIMEIEVAKRVATGEEPNSKLKKLE